MIVIIIAVFLNYSCSKDSDLLADYVVNENAGNPGNLTDLQDGTIITYEDKMVAINILRDIQSSAARKGTVLKKVTPPKNGKTEIKTDSTIVYTPNKDFTGKDDVVYVVEETAPDNTTVEKENTVTVAVNPVLETKNDQVQTTADKKVVIPVLKNDTYSDKNTATVTQTTTPAKGTVIINNDNTLTYTPNADASGSDTFTYTAQVDNAEKTASTTNKGTVTVTIDGSTTTPPTNLDLGGLAAFPGAEGFGKNTTGGRGGSVIEVTNLSNSGTGSLRAALEASGKRTVVFKVSGYIDLSSSIYIRNGDITVAGQTAPDGGITIRGAGIEINTSNVIIRYIRVRPGANTSNTDGIGIVNTSGTISNIIIDHCSVSWATDENIGITGFSGSTVKDITIQNSILGEDMGSGAVLLMSGARNISFYRNYVPNNPDRIFHASNCGPQYEVINNLIYNNKRGTTVTYECKVDVIGNYYKNSSVSAAEEAIRYTTNVYNCPDGIASNGSVYQNDNTVINWTKLNPGWSSSDKGLRVFSNSLINPSPSSTVPDILSNVGANIYPDAVDKRLINDYNNGTGKVISSESSVGGYPTLNSGKAYTDTDGDGIEDSWELANNLDPKDKSDGQKISGGNGYSNLEVFLHYLTIK